MDEEKPAEVPEPNLALNEHDAAKVRGWLRQVAAARELLATAVLQFEADKGKVLRQLNDLDAKARELVSEEAAARGFDPAKTSFDWVTLTFKVAP